MTLEERLRIARIESNKLHKLFLLRLCLESK
ncbi:hypothetical protein LCGC14_1391870 [marine sediment metagenome]|uniref:Uncharacterized protein n=1 Tax=marine sediment metagenome TaxID=412755 RepID=A0A0F9JZT2_9ZZZZ